jgi:hypothetical protein
MRKREWQSNHHLLHSSLPSVKLCCAVYEPKPIAQMLSQTGLHIEHLWGCLYISYTHTTHQNMQKDPGDGNYDTKSQQGHHYQNSSILFSSCSFLHLLLSQQSSSSH